MSNNKINITFYENHLIDINDDELYIHINNNLLFNNSSPLYKEKNLLIVGLGTVEKIPLLYYLKSLNFNKLICLTNSDLINNNIYKNIFDDIIISDEKDLKNSDKTFDLINNYHLKFDAIISYEDVSSLMSFFLSSKFNLINTDFEKSIPLKNKFEFRNICYKNKIICPDYFLLEYNNINKYLNKYEKLYQVMINNKFKDEGLFEKSNKTNNYYSFKYPLIIKPIFGSDKLFIKKINSLKDFINIILDIYNYNINIDFIIEEYIEIGNEYNIDILIKDNKLLNYNILKVFKHNEYNEDTEKSNAFDLDLDIDYSIIKSFIKKWIKIFDLKNGLFNIECIYDKEKKILIPIELNLSIKSSLNWILNKSIIKMDLFIEYLNICLNLEKNNNLYIDNDYLYVSKNIILNKKEINNIIINKNNIINNNNLLLLLQLKTKKEYNKEYKSLFNIVLRINNKLNIEYNEDNINNYLNNYILNILKIY